MSNKKLTILAVVAVLMVLWAGVQSRVSNRRDVEVDGPAYLVQGLDPADVASIISGTGEEAVTLKRQQAGFVVSNKDNYPAKTSEINDLFSKCFEIQTAGFITDNPDNHEDLEVTEEKARTVVKFMTADANSTVLAGVVVGKSEELGGGTYVRLLSSDTATSNKVYIASKSPYFGSGAMSYIEQELISVEQDDIESVTVSPPGGNYTLKTKEDSDEVVLENGPPAGKQFKSSDGRSVFTALTSLRCDDVKKTSADLTFDKQYVCKLKDSTVYTLKIAQKDDKTYIACEAEFTDKTPVTKDSDVESPEELKAKEAKLLARDGAQKFAAKHQTWVYEIADWKAKNLTKELADLIEDEEKPDEAEKTEDPNDVTVQEPATLEPQEPNALNESAVTEVAEPNAATKVEEPNDTKVEDPNTAGAK
jgi:hypothetical protein